MGGMEKTTVYLTRQQKMALASAAEAEGRSEARLIRDGVDAVTARHRAGEAPAVLADDARGLPRDVPSLDRPRWIARDDFLRLVLRNPADAALRAELRDLAPGTTDDEPIP
jgi:hypothetical protein